MLFPHASRVSRGPKLRTESQYEFLQRSSRGYEAAVRSLLETWLAQHPRDEVERLREHIQSCDDARFEAAFFELYVGALLQGLGCKLEAHPELSEEVRTTPEFLVQDPAGVEFVVEVTTTSEKSQAERTAQDTRDAVLDAIDSVHHPMFWLSVSERGLPRRTLPARSIAEKIWRWVDSLDVDQVSIDEQSASGASRISRTWKFDGWELECRVIAKPIERRGSTEGRFIKLHGPGARRCNTKSALRRAVKKKATKYGRLERPYVVAVNIDSFFLDAEDMSEALISTVAQQYSAAMLQGKEPLAPESVFVRDGVWLGPDGACNTRVGAVLVASKLDPWSVAQKDIYLYHNPWGALRVEGTLTQMSEYIPIDGRMEFKEGRHPRDVFGLSADWPDTGVAA